MTKTAMPRDSDEAFWNDAKVPVIREELGDKRVYDLEERTARFGEAVIDFTRAIPQDAVTNRIINQLVGAATSVGANYVEADDAVSKKEFLKSIGTCKKETREVKPFLRMAVRAVPELKHKARSLWLEARELHLITRKFGGAEKMNNEVKTRRPNEIRGASFVIWLLLFIRHSLFAIRHFSYVH